MTVERTVALRFGSGAQVAATHTNLSAVISDGPVLWVAGDETATIERLSADDPADPREYGDQTSFSLADLVDLPDTGVETQEADIEGMARHGPYLWAVGSHSLRRKKVKTRHGEDKALRRLATVSAQANRQLLARVPVRDTGLPELARETDGGRHRAATFGPHGTDLRQLLADDEHLAPFLPLPGKDNGLDVEGIAVGADTAEERVFLGLRGPVLRGWAVVLELRPRSDPDAPHRLRLGRFDDGRSYRKRVLDLHGLGVRDLCPYGEDLLVLAGPSMDLDGPVRLFRWHGALAGQAPMVVRDGSLTLELDLPYGVGDDHAEGVALLGAPEDGRLLVVYDSPSAARLGEGGTVTADVVRLPLG